MRFVKTAESIWNIPSGFKRVAYLESTGTQYIDTGITGNVNTKIDVQFAKKNTPVDYINGVIGARGSSASSNNMVVGLANAQIALDFNNSNYATYRYIASNTLEDTVYRAIISKEERALYQGDTLIGSNTTLCTDNIQTTNIWMFKVKNYGGVYAKIYYCKIWDNDTLVRDFIPCIDPLGRACMYDLVGKKAYYNQGTGEFTVGRQIIPVEYLESTGTQYIDTGLNYFADFEVGIKLRENVSNKALGNIGTNCLERNNATDHNWRFSSNGPWDSNIDILEYHIMKWKEDKIYADDLLLTEKVKIKNTGYYMTLFGTGAYYPNMIYFCKLWNPNDGTLVRDFIPCKDENNVGFMFDSVSGTVYENAGTGAFVVGNNKYKMKLRLIRDNILPTGYTQVEYLESTGTQYIDTGYIPKPTSSYKCEFELTNITTTPGAWFCVFGSVESNNVVFTELFLPRTSGGGDVNQVIVSNHNSTYIRKDYVWAINTPYEFEMTTTDVSINDVSQGSITVDSSVTCSHSIYLFARHEYNDVVRYNVSAKVRNFQVLENNTLVHNFIPALDQSGTPCMYDLVSKTPFYNIGTGTFITGKPVLPILRFPVDPVPTGYKAVNYLESTGTQYIDTGVLANGSFDAEYKIKTDSINTRAFIVAGARTSTQHLNFGQYEPSNRQFILAYLNTYWSISNKISSNTEYETKVHYESGNQYAVLNGETIGNNSLSGTEQLDMNIYLFKRNFHTPSTESIQPMIGRIYYFKIWDNNTLVRNFIPVIRLLDNKAGMWDTVTKQFYGNAGTGDFITG